MLNCKVRCTEIKDYITVVSKGSIYEFKNGVIILDSGSKSSIYDTLEDFHSHNRSVTFELIVENYKTLEMMILAEENGKTYVIDSLAYNKKEGFHSYKYKTKWNGRAFGNLNELVELDNWKEVEDHKEMTITGIQKELGYKIKIVE